MSALDLNAGGVVFEYKSSGTSVGIKVDQDGKSIGKFVPENSATNVEGQVVAYQLARFLYMSELVMPSDYYLLRGSGAAKFKSMLQGHSQTNKWRRLNREDVLAKLNRDGEIPGVFTPHTKFKSPEVQGLADDGSNTINRSHPIAQWIRAEGPMPSTRQMSLKGVKNNEGRVPVESEIELARQFSEIMVLDILTGQWDRWSGGNVEAGYDGDRVFFWSRDNGGSSINGGGVLKKYSSIVTRFTPEQVERLKALAAALGANPSDTAKQLKLKSKPSILLARVNATLEHIADEIREHGANRALFPPR